VLGSAAAELQRRKLSEYVVPTAELLIWTAMGDMDRCHEALGACIHDGVNGAVIACWFAAFLPTLAREPRFDFVFTQLSLAQWSI